jgi:hypothetical protein
MTEADMLMGVKVTGLVIAGLCFVVWQLRDVARAQGKSKSKPDRSALDTEGATAGDRDPTPDGHH